MLKKWITVIRETFQDWNEDKAPRLAAALAYYTVFSIAPFLLVVITIAGLVFGPDAVRGQVMGEIQGLVGEEGALFIQEMLQSAYNPEAGLIAGAVGIITLLFGAAGVLVQLEDALNTVWEVPPKKTKGIVDAIKQRLAPFTFLLGVGFLLMVSLVISAVIATLNGALAYIVPGDQTIAQVLNFAVSYGILTGVFALMFKYLPDAKIAWRDVIVGAFATSLLFNIGKLALGLYLGNSGVSSTYGAAGSLVVILLWIYYSTQILLLGAEFTQVYARHFGSRRRLQTPKFTRHTNGFSVPAVAPADTANAQQRIPAPISANRNMPSADQGETRLRPVFGLVSLALIMLMGWFFGKKPDSDTQENAHS